MRNFKWCRQEVAEFCLLDEEHVHICITTPRSRAIRPRCGRTAINLFFHDLDPEAIRRTDAAIRDAAKAQELIDGCLTEQQAREIVAFVQATPEDKTVLINCEAGISRSPGVVLALRRHYGGDTEEVFNRAHPNVHVTSLVTRVLSNRS